MPRPLPPNAEALRAQAMAPAPATSEPEANPVEIAFDLLDDAGLSLRAIACAVSAHALVLTTSADDTSDAANNARKGAALLAQAAFTLCQSMLAEDEPEAPGVTAAGGTE